MKLIITTILLLSCALSQAQSFQAQYVYDANGNRTKATIVYLSLKSEPSDLNQILPDGSDTSNLPRKGWAPGVNDSLNQYKVTIYPNPTHGNLLVQINGAMEQLTNNSNFIKIWNMQGQLQIDVNPLTTNNLIDLSQYAAGSYILKVYLNGQVKDFKIVKE